MIGGFRVLTIWHVHRVTKRRVRIPVTATDRVIVESRQKAVAIRARNAECGRTREVTRPWQRNAGFIDPAVAGVTASELFARAVVIDTDSGDERLAGVLVGLAVTDADRLVEQRTLEVLRDALARPLIRAAESDRHALLVRVADIRVAHTVGAARPEVLELRPGNESLAVVQVGDAIASTDRVLKIRAAVRDAHAHAFSVGLSTLERRVFADRTTTA